MIKWSFFHIYYILDMERHALNRNSNKCLHMKWMCLLFSVLFFKEILSLITEIYRWSNIRIDLYKFDAEFLLDLDISSIKNFGPKHPHTCKLDSAICFNPVDKLFNLAGVKERRDNNGLAKPDLVPSSKSLAFASRICDCFVIRSSAKLLTAAARSSGVSDCKDLLPDRAGNCNNDESQLYHFFFSCSIIQS